jgi:peptide deformylase
MFNVHPSIVTVDSSQAEVLRRKAENIQESELGIAKEISEKLYAALEPYFPAAGLAAPQIGISKAVFIFSYDRDPKHLEVVINPTWKPLGDAKVKGWENCISAMPQRGTIRSAKLSRYEKIEVSYLTIEGEKVERVLEGFAAKAFQHEYDHLQGIVNIDREDAEVKSFENRQEFTAFMQDLKKQDAARYIKPQ